MWPCGRVSLGPVTSSTVCSVATGLGLMPLSIDFALISVRVTSLLPIIVFYTISENFNTVSLLSVIKEIVSCMRRS